VPALGRALSLSLSLVCALLALCGSARALDVPPLGARVNDLAGVLSAPQKQQLEAELAEYESTTQHQLILLTLPSLEGEPLEDFSIRVADAWKLGKRDRDDGILLLVAMAERKLRIEVGYGLEGDLPDAVSSRIIREVMTPAFRAGQPGQGIIDGLAAIMQRTGGAPNLAPVARRGERHVGLPPLAILLLLALFFIGGGGRGGFFGGGPMGFGRRGRGFGGGFGGGGFGGGGGNDEGGFGGGGGGRFGGGGASGGW
jgi:uncharacterized protein